jgi:arabinogalactan oligomer/maltooligosaccharide transport system permease protein
LTLAHVSDNFRQNRLAYFYILPAFAVMGFVVIYPFIYNFVISLSNMSLTHFKDWRLIGFSQYVKVFSEGRFYWTFLYTVGWTVLNVFFHVVIGVGLALLLNRPLKGRAVFRALLILPWALPQYITALTWRGMFNYRYGAVNLILNKYFGIAPIEWLSTPAGAFVACLITNIWLGFPFMMVIALGALQSIPGEMYEAAEIDGAGWWRRLWSITVPLIKPVMVPAITLGVIWTFNNFNVIWLVSDGGKPADATHILVSFVYRQVFNYYRYGYAAALSLVIFGILLIFGIRFIRGTKATEGVY